MYFKTYEGNLLQYKLKIKSVNNGIGTKSSHSICQWSWLPKGDTKFLTSLLLLFYEPTTRQVYF